jgi:hypothetical protein
MTAMRRCLVFAACAAMVLAVGRPSSAATIDAVGDNFNVVWSFAGCGGTCTADASFDVTAFDATTLVMDVTINNTLNAAGEFLVGIGWNMDPTATGASLVTAGTYFDNVRLDQTFPSFNNINVCVDDNGQGSCGAGQATDGIPSPGSDSFTISLTGDFSGGSVILDTFAAKFAGDLGSFEGGGSETSGGTDTGATDTGATTGGEIPEPTSMLLLGSGLAAAAMRMRRNRK